MQENKEKAYCAVHSTKQVTASPYVLAGWLAGRQAGSAFLRARVLLGRRRHDLAWRTALAGHRQVCLCLECFGQALLSDNYIH